MAGFQRARSHVSWIVLLLSACVTIGGCGKGDSADGPNPGPVAKDGKPSDSSGLTSQPLSDPGQAAPTLFERMASERTHVEFISPIDQDHPRKYLYHSGFFAGGAAIGDVNGDGLPDLLLVSGPRGNRLYVQTEAWRFKDVTKEAGVDGGDAWGAGAAMIDIDNDGDLDLYICNYDSPNQLYVNDGAGKFEEKAAAYGLDITDASIQPAFCDYDNDGDLDLYLVTYRYYYPQGIPESLRDMSGLTMAEIRARISEHGKYVGLKVTPAGRSVLRPVGRPDRLMQNNGDGTFTDVSAAAGMTETGFGLSAAWWDYDGDGRPDLYVANDFADPDRLYRNNGDGTFTESIGKVVPHTSNTSMGSDVADLNNDGLLDFLVADMSATTHFKAKTTMGSMGAGIAELQAVEPHQYMRNALYIHSGTGRFMEAAFMAGLAKTDWTWAVKLADFDNDGRCDAFFTNGITREFNDSDYKAPPEFLLTHSEWEAYAHTKPRPEQNLAYRNRGDLAFEDASKAWGLDHIGISGAAAYGDFDNDGDLDLVVINADEPAHLYRNHSTKGHRVVIQLKGTSSNRWGIGAIVSLESASGVQVRQLNPVTGFASSNDPRIHFGLGNDTVIQKLTVRWPSGHEQTFSNVEADRLYTIEEPADTPAPAQPAPEMATILKSSDALQSIVSRETYFDDYARQSLLPNSLSQLGPGMAVGDVDGDGDEDLFVGGAAGKVGSLVLNTGNGQFTPRAVAALDRDVFSEDMGALFFDADGDGDLDLYVVSGSIECEPGDSVLRDRLYLNDGHGEFTRVIEALPDLRDSGSCVVAADFDRDGDLDLFVGGRSIPGQYPMTPNSRLLRNEGGRFVDVTDEVAPGLMKAGMVTGAIWSDVDNDGDPDLLVAAEWQPIRLWSNEGGKLTEATESAGLAARRGWWNGIAGGDVDGDGDIDFVVTNFGLNTKYHASPEHPVLIYYGDLTGEGKANIVEAEFEGNICYPVRGKSCSTLAMPALAEKFPTYKEFALASLTDLYTDTRLNNAVKFEVNELRTGLLINDGTGRFEFRALPRMAQIAPAYGAAIVPIDGDRHADILLAQNFYTPQVETGRMAGGLSLLLHGNGDGTFTPVRADRSGLVVPKDAKSLVITDFNGDARPDLVIGINDQPVQAFTSAAPQRMMRVTLRGPTGNLQATGARVELIRADQTMETREVFAGGGYLSQSSNSLFFSIDDLSPPRTLKVRWPDGTMKDRPISREELDTARVIVQWEQ